MYTFVSSLFQDPMELLTIEWSIGHAMLDPHSFSKTVILYGEGGHGKSTMIEVINSALMGCCGTIPDGALSNLGSGLKQDVASIVASNRVVTAGDVGGADRNTNLSVIKSITGHDFIQMSPSRVKTACTLFYATNHLDDPNSNPEWKTPAIMRRVVVVLMNAPIMDDFSGKVPYDPVSRLDFALRCVHTRLSYPYMPVSGVSIVYTLVGSKMDEISKFIVARDAQDCTEDDSTVATSIVAGAIGITTEEAGQLARRVSKWCVIEIGEFYYIKGIAPSKVYKDLYEKE